MPDGDTIGASALSQGDQTVRAKGVLFDIEVLYALAELL
jgi:hypothetical protein